jgi:hypothetical protein
MFACVFLYWLARVPKKKNRVKDENTVTTEKPVDEKENSSELI